MARVVEAAEKSKVELSNSTTSEISLPYITVVDNVPQHLNLTLTRANFENMISKEIDKVINCGKEAMKKANLEYKELDGILLVGGSTRIPYVQERLTKEFGVELLKNVAVDEAVALGAAIQGSILAGDSSEDIVLVDVLGISVGIETMGNVFTKLVESNTSIPTKRSQIFTTAEDNQPAVTIAVYQGERPMARDNRNIGMFTLDGIPAARRGVPQIEVTFDIDANGILTVSATDKGTGKEQHITINGATSLSDDDIERMKKEAKDNEAADKKVKEEADKLNNADQLVFQTEKALEEVGDKATDDEKKSVQDSLDKLKGAVKEKNLADIETYTKEVQEAFYKISAKLYGGNGGDGGQSNTGFDFTNGNNPFGGK